MGSQQRHLPDSQRASSTIKRSRSDASTSPAACFRPTTLAYLNGPGTRGDVGDIVAAKDWVVAIFPMLFEQIATWSKQKPTTGLLDLGGAGFKGFQDRDDPQGRVRNVQFANGGHGIGVDTSDPSKLGAIVSYAMDGNEQALRVFENVNHPLNG